MKYKRARVRAKARRADQGVFKESQVESHQTCCPFNFNASREGKQTLSQRCGESRRPRRRCAKKDIFLHFSPSLPLVHYLICALCLHPESAFARTHN